MGLDCWQFFELVYREVFRISLDALPAQDRDERLEKRAAEPSWRKVAFPRDGDGIVLCTRPAHVGIVADAVRKKMIHAPSPKLGAKIECWGEGRWRHRELEFWRHSALDGAGK